MLRRADYPSLSAGRIRGRCPRCKSIRCATRPWFFRAMPETTVVASIWYLSAAHRPSSLSAAWRTQRRLGQQVKKHRAATSFHNFLEASCISITLMRLQLLHVFPGSAISSSEWPFNRQLCLVCFQPNCHTFNGFIQSFPHHPEPLEIGGTG